MKTPIAYPPGSRATNIQRIRDAILLASFLALGVVAWQHFFHAYALGHSETLTGHLTHSLRDAALAFVPALLAVGGGLWLARRLGVVRDTRRHLLGRAAIISITFTLFAALSVGAHSFIDTGLTGGVASAVEASNGGGLEDATGLSGLALHGVRDALVGQSAALPLAVAGLALAALLRGDRAPERRDHAVGCRPRRRARWAVALAPAGIVLIAVSMPGASWHGSHGAALAQGAGPCPAGAPIRVYDVSAINVDIPLNRFGDHDPISRMYVLTENIAAVRAQESSQEVSLGLRDDIIQPLVIRANMGDCLEITFANQATGGHFGIHIDGLIFDIDSSGDAVGNNPPSDVPFGGTRTYRWFVPNEPALEGVRYLHSGPGNRQYVAHGLFGALVVEPEGSTYLHPDTALPMDSGWEAIIVPGSGAAFREYVIIYHEVGDETYRIRTADGGTLPLIDPHTGTYRPGGRALNYRSEPFFNLLENAPEQEAQAYGSYTFGDVPTPMPRAYLADPSKTRILHGGSEVFHVHHLHGGTIRWRWNPNSDPTWDYADTGLDKYPATQQSPSTRLDSQTIGPGESYNLEHEGGAGGLQQVAADFLFHCHIAHHYLSGMWSFWRVFDTLQPDLAPLPDRTPPPEAVDSAELIGLTMLDGSTLTADNLDDWTRPQLPSQGVSQSRHDAAVWDWVIDASDPAAPLYLGEVEDPGPFPNLPNVVPGHPGSFASDELVETPEGFRPKIMFNPLNGRPAFPPCDRTSASVRPSLRTPTPAPPGWAREATSRRAAPAPTHGRTVQTACARPPRLCVRSTWSRSSCRSR